MRILIGVALLLVAGVASAQRFGDWAINANEDGSVITAETRNESGASFGLICFTDSSDCMWSVSNGNECTDGELYPVMANASSGAASFNQLCSKIGSGNLLTFTDYDGVMTMVTKNGRIGFAVPMADGMFTVTRFSLRGANEAIDKAQELVLHLKKSSTRDVSL